MTELPPGYRKTALQIVQETNADLTNRVVILTGGSSGIGVETLRAFAKAGARVFNFVRDLAKASSITADIRESTGNSKLEDVECDLSSRKSINDAISIFKKKNLPVHYLILNAGLMMPPEREATEDNLEIQFAVNVLANYLLMTQLLPNLQRAAKGELEDGSINTDKSARVVIVSSCAHLRQDVNWDDIQFEKAYEKFQAYASSKSGACLLALHFNNLYKFENIYANSLHPGGIMTGLQKFMSHEAKIALGWIDKDGNINPLFKNVEEGAATTLYVALSPALEKVGGEYFEDCDLAIPSPRFPVGFAEYIKDASNAEKFYKYLESLNQSKL